MNEEDQNREIEKLKQHLINSSYPLKTINSVIYNFFRRRNTTQQQPSQSGEEVKLYYRNQWSSTARQEEERLKSIVEHNITSQHTIKLLIYYKQRKLASQFAEQRNPPVHHLVYNFKCSTCSSAANCQYIGYTTCTIDVRCKKHQYSGAIKVHYATAHDQRVSGNAIKQQTVCRFKSTCERELRIAESILIQAERPSLNTRDEFRTHTLKVFNCLNKPTFYNN